MDDNIYASSPRELSTLAKELTAATRVMQSSFNKLSTLVSGKVNVNKQKQWRIILELAEQ